MSDGFRKRWFKHRVAALLLILLGVLSWRAVIRTEEDRRVDWRVPHRVTICPLIAPGTDAGVLSDELAGAASLLDAWASEQHEYWRGRREVAIDFEVLPAVQAQAGPPWLPEADDSFWTRWRETSRFLRYLDEQGRHFAARSGDDTRLYLYIYRDSDSDTWEDRLPVGTKRNRIGVAFASERSEAWGNVLCVIAHETMHALGAPDHRLHDDTIAHPQGYADPSKDPLYPQEKAEIMALGIPVSDKDERRVDGLEDVVMGLWTARAIGWR